MSNRTIFTETFRVSFPHLAKPHTQKPGDVPKYQVSMMFPKTGICPLNNQASNYNNIWQALDEVCMEEFGCGFEAATAPGMGINYPPKFKDGDTVFEKDANKNPIPGKIAPQSAGMWILSAKNEEPVGTVNPGAPGIAPVDIAPSAIYAGCWARAQLEVSAYTGNHGRVVVVKLLNVQMMYDDERFGGKTPTQAASSAFADKSVADSNVQAGYGQTGAMPAVNNTVAPAPGAAPVPTPSAAPATPKLVMIATDYTYEQYIAAGHTDETLVSSGFAKMETPTPAAPTPAPAATAPSGAPKPGIPKPNVPSAAPAAPTPAPAAPTPAPAAPAAPTPAPAAPAAPAIPPVTMNPGEASYEEYKKMGWDDEAIIQHGKGVPTPNYLNPAQ